MAKPSRKRRATDLIKSFEEIVNENETLQTELERLKSEKKKLDAQTQFKLRSLSSNIDCFQAEAERHQKELVTTVQEKEKLQKEVERTKNGLSDKEKEVSELKAGKVEIDRQLMSATRHNDENQSAIRNLLGKVRGLDERIEEYSYDAVHSHATIKNLKEKAEKNSQESEKKIMELKKEVHLFESKPNTKDLEIKIETLESDLVLAQQRRLVQETKIKHLSEYIDRMTKDHETAITQKDHQTALASETTLQPENDADRLRSQLNKLKSLIKNIPKFKISQPSQISTKIS